MTLFEMYQSFLNTHPIQKKLYNGQEIKYRLFGHGNQMILALLSGSMLKTNAYFKMLSSFEVEYQVMTLEMPSELIKMDHLADVIHYVLKSLEIDQVYLLGASFGGSIAQVFAKKYPSFVQGMILYNTLTQTNLMNEHSKWVISQVLEAIHQIKELRKLMPLSAIKDALINQISEALSNPRDLDVFEALIHEYTEHDEKVQMALILDLLTNYHFKKEDFSFLKQRVLVLYGNDDDPFGGTELIETLADVLTEPILKFIEADKLSLVIDPNPLIKEVKTFIK